MGVAARRLSAGEAGLGTNFWGSSSSPSILKKEKPLNQKAKRLFFLKNGRGEKIRTSDPHNPIVVRYQAALRPDRICVGGAFRPDSRLKPLQRKGGNDNRRGITWKEEILAAQNLKDLFKFRAYLLDNLLTLRHIRLGVVAGQALARSADREAFVIQKTTNLTNDQDVLALVIASVAASLDRL